MASRLAFYSQREWPWLIGAQPQCVEEIERPSTDAAGRRRSIITAFGISC